MTAINYSERIPNNVHLTENRRLRRALEAWRQAYLDWWREMGPAGLQTDEVYLRTAVSVDTKGWADYGHTRMLIIAGGSFFLHRNRTGGFCLASMRDNRSGPKRPENTGRRCAV